MSNFDLSDLGGVKNSSEESPRSSFDLSDLGGKLESPQTETSFGDKALALGKGFVSGVGGSIPDLASTLYNIPAIYQNWQSKQIQQFARTHPEQANQLAKHYGIPLESYTQSSQLPIIPSATEAIEQGIESSTGIKTPEDIRGLYEGIKFGGGLAGFGGVAKAAGKLGMKALEKVGTALGATTPSQLAGGVAAGTAMHEIGEEYGPLAALPIAAGVGAFTQKGIKGLQGGLEGIKGSLTGKGSSLGEMTVGKAISKLGKSAPEIEHLAKKYDIDLPFNIRLQGGAANFMANMVLSTVFKSKEYSNQIANAPKKMVDIITNKINSVAPENLGNIPTSQKFKDFLIKEQERVREAVNKLYNTASEYIKPNEIINMGYTVDAIKDLRSILTAPSPSAPQKFVIKKVNELADHLGILEKIKPPKGFTAEQFEDPKIFEQVLKQLEENPNISAKMHDMIQQRKAYLYETDYGEVRGAKVLLGRLTSALNKDISNTSNKEFLKHWKVANSYYKEESVNRVRSDLANALTTGDIPKEAYNFMTSASDIKQLGKIIGNSKNGQKIFNDLKRAKLQDVVLDKLVNADGFINHAIFVKMFSKGNKEQSILQELLPKKTYNDLQELGTLSKAFSKAATQYQNASGTTKRAQDFGKAALVGGGLIDLVMTGGTKTLLAGASAIATPYLMSKVLANPKYIDAAVKFGKSFNHGRVQDAISHDNRMKKLFLEMAQKETPSTINKEISPSKDNKKY